MTEKQKITQTINDVAAQEYKQFAPCYIELLKETAAVESDYGKTSTNIMQVEKDVARDLSIRFPEKLKDHGVDPDNYDLQDPKTNVVFGMMSYIDEKEIKEGTLISNPPTTRSNRYDMWKSRYNTLSGKGTRKDYLEKANLHVGRIDDVEKSYCLEDVIDV